MLERATAVFRPTCAFQKQRSLILTRLRALSFIEFEDLEATKAAVNQGVVPKISLSVSGWVGEQVTVTK